MDLKRLAWYEARARIIKAMAHPSRLLILDELARGRYCVAELTAVVGSDVSTVSKHLAVLREAGIVEGKRSGAQIYYGLRVPCVLNFFGCIEAVIRSKAKEQMKLIGK